MPLMHDAAAVNGRWELNGIFKNSLKFEYLINKGRLKTGIVDFQTTFAAFQTDGYGFEMNMDSLNLPS